MERPIIYNPVFISVSAFLPQQSCSAVQGIGKKMDKNIKEGMQWLLQGIQNDWDSLHERVEAEMAAQKEAEAAARKERIARVKKIREERYG